MHRIVCCNSSLCYNPCISELGITNPFSQFTVGSTNNGNSSTASNMINNNNSDYNTTDKNPASDRTTIATINSSTASSNKTTESTITIRDVVNSTYLASKGNVQEGSERKIVKAVRDRITNLLHTAVRHNATIISTATIINEVTNESNTINNNNTRFEILDDQAQSALANIRIYLNQQILC
jgi:hypothetical protein